MTVGGVILCGGRSLRMGQPKAWLPVGGEPMLARVARILGEVVSPVMAVAAPGQELPPLPPATELAHDAHESHGPLEGLAAGLAALAGRADAAFVTGCDFPLLAPAFVRLLISLLDNAPACVPSVGGYVQPLAGVYRVDLLPTVRQLLAEDRRSLHGLLAVVPARVVPARELVAADPQLDSLRNVNTPADYEAVLRVLG